MLKQQTKQLKTKTVK